jgi:lyso-ornithine lipid O-acyltransferase
MTSRRIRLALRIFRLGYVLGAVILITLLLYPWLAASVLLRYRQGQRLIPKVYHRLLRTLLGIRICAQGGPSSHRPLLVVANHTSWLDIVIISSFLPIVFVAKQEVARLPIFGWLAKLQRSIFVNRDRRHDVHATISCVADSLAAGEVVGIFPEGTSTDGTTVFPFRSALIGAVGETLRREKHMPAIFIQPVSVAYVGPNQRLAIWAREDEIPFVPHLLQVISLRRIDVALAWGDPIAADVLSDRKVLTRHLEAAVRELMPKRTHKESSGLAADSLLP